MRGIVWFAKLPTEQDDYVDDTNDDAMKQMRCSIRSSKKNVI